MKQLNCDFLQLTIRFDEKKFKRKELSHEAELKGKKNSGFTALVGSRTKTRKEHAHVYLYFDGEDSILKLDFVPESHTGNKDTDEPYIETIGEWFAKFFYEDVIADVMVVFKYTDNYESVMPIHYPLLIKNGLLKGAEIAGYEIAFPTESLISRASISSNEKTLLVILNAKFKLDLSDFEVHDAIERFSVYAKALVEKKEAKK